MKKWRRFAALPLAAVAVAMTAFVPQRSAPGEYVASASTMPAHVNPPNAVRVRTAFTNGADVRALTLDADGDAVWAATSAGVDRYDGRTHARTHFGIDSGLDSLDVRAVHIVSLPRWNAVVVDTAASRCIQSSYPSSSGFRCVSGRPPAPNVPTEETFEGAPVVARLAVAGGSFVATRGRGVWFEGATSARLDAAETAPASFVRKVVFYKHQKWAGTFDDGLVTLDATGSRAVTTMHVRMVNDLAATKSTLFVAANEGFFYTRDGASFERIDVIGHGATGVAVSPSDDHVFVTTTAAIWRVRVRDGHRPIVDGNWWRPAGTRSIQGIALSPTPSELVAWIATEDRGVIRFDASSNAPRFTSFDKLAGAPTSWVVALAADARGGVFAATLRDGVFHVDRNGAYTNVVGVPNSWTLSASFESGRLCVGTQAGAACWNDWTKAPSRVFTRLPDARVHDIEHVDDELVVATEAGIAIADAT